MKAHHHAVKVEALPPNLVLPLKQNVGLDVGAGTSVCVVRKTRLMISDVGRTGYDQ
jgi:hypothetical protein